MRQQQSFLSTDGIIFPTLQTLNRGFFQYLLADIQWSIAPKFHGTPEQSLKLIFSHMGYL
jgi:hypothetical protein